MAERFLGVLAAGPLQEDEAAGRILKRSWLFLCVKTVREAPRTRAFITFNSITAFHGYLLDKFSIYYMLLGSFVSSSSLLSLSSVTW